MGENAGRLDVLTRQTPRIAAGASAAELTWDQMWHRANVLANSGMVRKAYEGKPEAIMYAGAKGAELGWSLVASLDFIDPIEGRAEVNAQGRLALIRQAGHEAEVLDGQCSDTIAVVRGRRRGSQDWHVVTWTIEEAETAGLRAEWVKRWVDGAPGRKGHYERVALRREGNTYVPAKFGQTELPEWAKKLIAEGKVECNDSWWNYPGDKLVARAASRLCRRHFSEVLIGRGLSLHTADEQGYETASDLDETAAEGVITARVVEDRDEEVIDGELIEQGEDTVMHQPLTENERAALLERERARMAEPGYRDTLETAPGDEDPKAKTAAPAEDRETLPSTSANEGAAGGPVVGSAAAPGPLPRLATGGVDWRDACKRHGVTQADLLRQAQEFAKGRALPVPETLAEITDEQLEADLTDWLGAPA